MTCNVIATGSGGNAVHLDGRLLLDCGVPRKRISPIQAGLNLVLLTHIHGDHFNKITVRDLARDRPTLRFGCCEWLVQPLTECGVEPRRIDCYACGKEYTYHISAGTYVIEPFLLHHDVANCGYKITLPSRKKVLYATDTGHMDDVSAPDFDLYLIEANHDIEALQGKVREKHYHGQFAYEERAACTHMSKQQTDEWLVRNAASFSEIIYLHEHQDKPRESEK